MIAVNQAGWDRILRVLVGMVTLWVGVTAPLATTVAVLIVVAGLMLVVIGTLGWCPIYDALGVRTLRRRSGKSAA